MKNVHLLPTDKPSRLVKFFTNKFHLCKEILPIQDEEQYQNIYITNNEKIKEGDRDFYILANDRDGTWINRVEKVIECKIDPNHGKVLILSSGFIYIDEGCKIILTDDPDLIADGVQAIDNEFLEWFVKNPSCEQVEIYQDKKDYGSFQWYSEYKIIIPKEEPKQEFLEKISSIDLSPEFQQLISDNLDDLTSYEPKQETLEEVIKVERSDLYNKIHSIVKQIPREDVETDAMDASSCAYDIEQLFYKWQQERMYSEEDMIMFAFNTYHYISELMGVPFNLISENKLHAMYNFEQFKNK
jgi:hypothetical protein